MQSRVLQEKQGKKLFRNDLMAFQSKMDSVCSDKVQSITAALLVQILVQRNEGKMVSAGAVGNNSGHRVKKRKPGLIFQRPWKDEWLHQNHAAAGGRKFLNQRFVVDREILHHFFLLRFGTDGVHHQANVVDADQDGNDIRFQRKISGMHLFQQPLYGESVHAAVGDFKGEGLPVKLLGEHLHISVSKGWVCKKPVTVGDAVSNT